MPRRRAAHEVRAAAAVSSPSPGPRLAELLPLGDAHRDGGTDDDERATPIAGHRRSRARSDRLRQRACGTTLALVALWMLVFVQGFIMDEVKLVLTSLLIIAALEVVAAAAISAASKVLVAVISLPALRPTRSAPGEV